MNSLISEVKQNNEDFEFYPTTKEIIDALLNDIENSLERYRKFDSILDIGAGNGKVLNALKEKFIKLYAIEKSHILRDSLDKSIFIIGTDFYNQSLFDKQMEVTFCNPPYSDYETWTSKIIKESCSKYVYLVIPSRWINCQQILDAIKYRDAKYKIIGDFTFENSEDRTARAKVNLIRIELSHNKDDAFDRFFKKEFSHLKEKFNEETKKETINKKFSSLVVGKDYVKNLVAIYNEEMQHIKSNYEKVNELDTDILKELGISTESILEGLKVRLKGLKNHYWNELISRMEEITNRIISTKRRKLLNTLQENGHVDFTESNVYAIILWILKNADKSIDEQLIEVYDDFISKANCKNYKSNEKVFTYDRWRYSEEKPSHIFLDYRIILSRYHCIEKSYSSGYYISDGMCEILGNLLTIAYNLGFDCNTADDRLNRYSGKWMPREAQNFYTGKEVLFEVKAHLNGNLHIRLNQKFALALNVEYGRLKGWIHSKEQACQELMDDNAKEFFKSNFTALSFNNFALLEHEHVA